MPAADDPGRPVDITYDATVIVPDDTEEADEDAPEIAPEDLPDDVLIYTLPSRYALPDVLGKEAWNRFGGLTPGYTRVQAICDYVNSHLTFQYGASNSRTTAADVHASGYGVCRDFTHLGVSLCRALNIPARYVFGYLPRDRGRRRWTPRWTSRPGWRSTSATAGGPSTRATTSAARAGC